MLKKNKTNLNSGLLSFVKTVITARKCVNSFNLIQLLRLLQ